MRALCVTTRGQESSLVRSLDSAVEAFRPDVTVVADANDPHSRARDKVYEWCIGARALYAPASGTNRGEGRGVASAWAIAEGADELVECVDTDMVYDADAVRSILARREDLSLEDLLYRSVGFHVVPARLLSALGGWDPVHVYEDRRLWVRAAKAGVFVYDPTDATVHLRDRPAASLWWTRVRWFLAGLRWPEARRFDPDAYRAV